MIPSQNNHVTLIYSLIINLIGNTIKNGSSLSLAEKNDSNILILIPDDDAWTAIETSKSKRLEIVMSHSDKHVILFSNNSMLSVCCNRLCVNGVPHLVHRWCWL